MINLDTVIKFIRTKCPYPDLQKEYWPEWSYNTMKKIKECLVGFPGIGLNDVSLLLFKDLDLSQDIWIFDNELHYHGNEERIGDEAPLMLAPGPKPGNFIIEGIGAQFDGGDIERKKKRWKDVFSFSTPFPTEDSMVLRIDCRPTIHGGPGYYYFFKAYRDQRL